MKYKYTREELYNLPLKKLQNLDIETPEQEAMVQEVMDEKYGHLAEHTTLNIASHLTDNLTPEKERALQARIDQKKAELMPTKAKKEVELEVNILEPQAPTDLVLELKEEVPAPKQEKKTKAKTK